uniref:Uncharacterized protein n=1 Tax=Setaria italica TaxID=4555 RepID=K3YF20_SETIT
MTSEIYSPNSHLQTCTWRVVHRRNILSKYPTKY